MITDKLQRENSISCRELLSRASGRGISICTAESCTGGLVGGALTGVPGASSVFVGSAVCYSNDSKTRILGVSPDILSRYGAVSAECASAMAAGARRIFHADMALSVTGVAGPDGGTEDKPVGLVWFSLEAVWERKVFSCFFNGERDEIRHKAVGTAIEILLRALGRAPA
jgi:PncC family amidohydrolase